MKEKRKDYIDIAKGIGIFTIVLVHLTERGSWLSQVLLSFCVAQFFIISGYLFSTKRNFVDFLINLFKKIVIPLFLYGCIDVLFTIVWKYGVLGEIFHIKDLIKMIAKITFVSGSANSNGPLWYLVTLLEIELIMYPLCKNNFKYKKVLQGLVFIIMILAGYFIKWKGPFRIGQIPLSFIFFAIGYFSKGLFDRLENISHKIFIVLISFIIFAITCKINGFSELSALNYGNYYLLYFIVAISITIAIITLSMLIKDNKILEYFGRNSLTIMCCHYYFTRFIIPLIFKILKVDYLLSNELIEILLAIFVMIVMVPIIRLVNNRCTLLCGKISNEKIKYIKNLK